MNSYLKSVRALTAVSLLAMSGMASAEIQSISATTVDLYAKQFKIATPDGDSLRMWGFATSPGGEPQYPAPTLRGDEGDFVTITVHNVDVPQGVSLVFPGQDGVQSSCFPAAGVPFALPAGACLATGKQMVTVGSNNPDAINGMSAIQYNFTLGKPGTFMYQSGVNPQVQVDMGLVGALIVDPTQSAVANGTITAGGNTTIDHHAVGLAYNDAKAAYDREYLFFLSETDPKLHYLAELEKLDKWDNGDYRSTLFFINGRNAPDTLAPDFLPQLPNQPYGALVHMNPGQRVLLRVVNAGRNQHPLHLHGNHFDQIARDGNLMGKRSADGSVEIRPVSDYTYGAVQGGTSDLIFHWTGEGLGWDMYGTGPGFEHDCVDNETNLTHASVPDGYDDVSWESCSSHGAKLPVELPDNLDLGFGGFWGGSPFLGNSGNLPVGEGGLNPEGGMVFMWHSHAERELTNNDIYPGGMLTMMLVVPYK